MHGSKPICVFILVEVTVCMGRRVESYTMKRRNSKDGGAERIKALPLQSLLHSFLQQPKKHAAQDAGRLVVLAGPLRLSSANPGL